MLHDTNILGQGWKNNGPKQIHSGLLRYSNIIENLTISVKQSLFSEANSHTASQEILQFFSFGIERFSSVFTRARL